MSETIETPAIDKSTWGDGAWQTEPDRVDFIHAGFACLALRHPRHGFWCAYVGLPREHSLYGKIWSETPAIRDLDADLNYSAVCDGSICHVPAPGMPADVWWLGMDFGHLFDIAPGMEARERSLGILPIREWPGSHPMCEVYRDLPYVRAEIESLADQLRAMAAGGERPERDL